MQTADIEENGRSIRVDRILYAPVALVWEAWTRPEEIALWWGPKGFSNTIHQMDVVAKGEWRLTMQGPDGKTYPNRSVFLEIEPFARIVFQHFNPNYLASIYFEPQGEKTRMSWKMLFETRELFDTVVKVFKADEGLLQNAEKLEEYLKQKKQRQA